jgi:hypothetical protein
VLHQSLHLTFLSIFVIAIFVVGFLLFVPYDHLGAREEDAARSVVADRRLNPPRRADSGVSPVLASACALLHAARRLCHRSPRSIKRPFAAATPMRLPFRLLATASSSP